MSELPYLKLYVEDFLLATETCSDAEVGLYLRLLLLAWRDPDNSLPDDAAAICRKLRVTAHNRAKVEAILKAFFDKTGDKWRQKRLDFERAKARQSYTQKVEASRSRWQKTKGKRRANGPPPASSGADATHNPYISFRNDARDAREGDHSDLKNASPEAHPSVQAIREGKRFLCTHVSAQDARRWVEAGLVTVEQCEAVGVL